MARKGTKNKKQVSLITVILSVLIACVLYLSGYEAEPGKHTNSYLGDGEAYIHIIDVGQGSSALIQQGSKGVLIDTGESDYSDYLISYINSCGVDYLEYVVASHPHSDHIGGICDVFDAFDVGAVVMPELSEINIPTSRVYERMMDWIFENDLEVIFPKAGERLNVEDITLTFFGPVKQMEDLNNMSLICKADIMNTSVMLPGDAEKQELSSVYKKVKGEYGSDILVMAHHGSASSLYKPFLTAVNAETAVVSCGKGNSYGHPHKETLDYISDNEITLYRTDKSGDIVFRCDADGYERVS